MTKLILSFLTTFLIGYEASYLQQPYSAKLVLYEGNNCNGTNLEIIEQYEPWLHNRVRTWNNDARSAEVTGVWLFYDFGNYNSKMGNAGVEYIFGANQSCQDFIGLMQQVSSVRFAGIESDYRNDSLTLYTERYFQGKEEFVVTDLPHINMEIQNSLIITGTSGWTLYKKVNYQGDMICVFPSNYTQNYSPAFVFDIKNVFLGSQNFIRSIRKGCWAGDVVTIDEVFHGVHNVTR